MLISNVNRFGCRKIRHIINAIGCCNFGTIPPAGQLNISNILIDSLNCKCIHRIPAHYQQLRNFHQTVPTLSSQSISKSETEDNDEQQLHQPSVKEENQEVKKSNANQQQTLAKNYTSIGSNHYLNIICEQGSSGQKYIEIKILIFKLPSPIVYKMAKILVPQEAYKFISAMDRLIGQLPEEKPTNPTEGDESPTVLASQMVEGGLRYDFKLSVVWHPKSGQGNLRIQSVKTVQEHKERSRHFPLWTLSWLREQMASMLVKHDGSEQINEPPTMPEWTKKARNLRIQTELGPNERAVPQQQVETEMDQPKLVELAKSFLPLGPTRKLHIECEQGRQGHKTIQIHIHSEQPLKLPRTIHVSLPKIHVPKEAYNFVAAMDRLIGQLPAPAKPPAANGSPPTLAIQMVEGGIFYDFQLSVVWFERGRRWDLKIRSVKTVTEHNEGEVQMQLWTLPWLRQEMATMLEKFDDTQRIDEMPTMPEWATQAPTPTLWIDKMPTMPEWAKQAPNIRLKS